MTQVLCVAGGALELEEWWHRFQDGVDVDMLEQLLRASHRFLVATRVNTCFAAAVTERVVLPVSMLTQITLNISILVCYSFDGC